MVATLAVASAEVTQAAASVVETLAVASVEVTLAAASVVETQAEVSAEAPVSTQALPMPAALKVGATNPP